MLPVTKQDTELDDASPIAAVGFGKVLSSIQGLQQRLGDFSYGEVSIAEAKVKILVKQLSLLRDNLISLSRLKLTIGELSHHKPEISILSFEEVPLNRLENYPRLHALLHASKGVSLPSFMSGGLVGLDGVLPAVATAGSSDHVLSAKNTAAKTALKATGLIDESEFAEAMKPTRGESGDTSIDESVAVAGHKPAPRSHNTSLPTDEPQKFTIPNESIAVSQEVKGGGLPKDWSFDPHESLLASSQNFAPAINFEFPDDTLDDPQPVIEKVVKSNTLKNEPSPTATTPHAAPNNPDATATSAGFSTQAKPEQPTPKDSAARLDESKALVPADQDIDQKLLADVIKTYGDFAGSPFLPATIDKNTGIMPVTETPANRAEEPTDQPTAAERKILNVQKSGDLDRQLKKIIKDYGEYDIYQRKSGISFKTGGIIAFAVLGIVLAALYLFKAPSTVVAPATGPAEQSQLPEPQNPLEAVGSPAAVAHPIGAEPTDAFSDPLKDD